MSDEKTISELIEAYGDARANEITAGERGTWKEVQSYQLQANELGEQIGARLTKDVDRFVRAAYQRGRDDEAQDADYPDVDRNGWLAWLLQVEASEAGT